MAATAAVMPASAQNWQLVFSDEFDTDGRPDSTKWKFSSGASGFGNNEAQFYSDSLKNARVENGIFIIEALKEDVGVADYTSARVFTRGQFDFTYGRVEVSARLPTGRGTWPAIWLLYSDNEYGNHSWPDNGEIDIMEHVGFDQGNIHATIHTAAYNGALGTQIGAATFVGDASTAFHVYAVEWTPSQIRAYVDDLQYFTYDRPSNEWTKWPFDHAMHIILNLAIGGNWGGQQGIDDSIFPQRMEVDYVRVYQEPDARPQIELESPSRDTTLAPGDGMSISVLASDPSGSVARVELLQGDGLIAKLETAPYVYDLTDLAAGCYSFRARAIDDEGWTMSSDTLSIQVGDSCVQAPYLMRYHRIPGVIEAQNYDIGGPSVAYSDINSANTGFGIRQDEGVDIEATSDADGDYQVVDFGAREWMEYTAQVETAGIYELVVRYASENGSSFQLDADGVPATGTVSLASTGAMDKWGLRRVDITLEAGVQVIRFTARSAGMNLNKIAFFLRSPSSLDESDVASNSIIESIYPNPAARRFSVQFVLDRTQAAKIGLYDLRGREIKTLSDATLQKGTHTIVVDASELSSGIYWVRIAFDGGTLKKSIAVVRS